jgi:penicillin amidase
MAAMRVLKALAAIVIFIFVVAGLAAGWAWWQVGRSLAVTSGSITVSGLTADVTITRDAFGVPTITGANRADVARALGFVHAQERFFQMDLARRRAAGELSELFGAAALSTDRSARLHRFRHRAAAVLAAEAPDNMAVIAAYSDGVNAGLAALDAAPFEYQLLRQTPRSWTPEDTILVVASMFFTLQDSAAVGDARTGALYEVFPEALASFLNSTASQWDTPESGDPLPAPVPPGPEVYELAGAAGSTSVTSATSAVSAENDDNELAFGSNNWAVAGSRTADGRAIVANDMHLSLGVPNIWFRASMTRPHNGRPLTVTGATLPGVPGLIVGSNGSIAWGFTNTTADWSDRIVLTVEGDGEDVRYLTPNGWQSFSVTQETIAVSGGQPESYTVRETIWGPVVGPDTQGRLYAITWVAHYPEGLNLRLGAMDEVTTLDEAMALANVSGTPAQNITMADASGHIAWTVAGRIPRRIGFDGSRPTSWADGTRRWDGWYAPDEYPRIINPASGVIVTANNRIVSGDELVMLGDGGYDPGARARQIREGLLSAGAIDYDAIMRVHLDDRAILMAGWRDMALTALKTAPATRERTEFARLVETTWTGRASVDSVGYRLVRQFRSRAAELAWAPFTATVRAVDPGFPATPGRSLEGPVWAMLTTQPRHLLDPKFPDWNTLMVTAIDDVVALLTRDGQPLASRTWGEANTLRAPHPISRAVPQLASWLDLPAEPLPGDNHMPRFQSATNGASERMAVSPGDEASGYFHMPGGQSGHPRSPHYQDGHTAWVNGTPTPFLPGPAVTTLVLRAR